MNAQVILCDNDKELDNQLIAALREAHGQAVEVFVLDHKMGDTVVVLLPEDGPSLAAALRDWVQGWWSDGDEKDYGTPEQYLRGFGVVIEPGGWTSFSTSCPYCGKDDNLEVIGGTFQTMGVPITPAGFDFVDASMMQTTEEMVQCNACRRTFSITKILF